MLLSRLRQILSHLYCKSCRLPSLLLRKSLIHNILVDKRQGFSFPCFKFMILASKKTLQVFWATHKMMLYHVVQEMLNTYSPLSDHLTVILIINRQIVLWRNWRNNTCDESNLQGLLQPLQVWIPPMHLNEWKFRVVSQLGHDLVKPVTAGHGPFVVPYRPTHLHRNVRVYCASEKIVVFLHRNFDLREVDLFLRDIKVRRR